MLCTKNIRIYFKHIENLKSNKIQTHTLGNMDTSCILSQVLLRWRWRRWLLQIIVIKMHFTGRLREIRKCSNSNVQTMTASNAINLLFSCGVAQRLHIMLCTQWFYKCGFCIYEFVWGIFVVVIVNNSNLFKGKSIYFAMIQLK